MFFKQYFPSSKLYLRIRRHFFFFTTLLRRTAAIENRTGIRATTHTQFVAPVQIGSGRVPFRHSRKRAQTSAAVDRRLRTRIAST